MEVVSTRQKRCAELIRQHSRSKLSVSAFCREHGVSDQSFYYWRKRLSGSEPVRFALVEANAPVTKGTSLVGLMLASGDRLRISPGADGVANRAERLAATFMMHLPARVRVYLCASA